MTVNKNFAVLDKGFYNHSQVSGGMIIKQYVVSEKGGKKYLLLRFFNESELCVNGMEIVVTQKGPEKQTLESSLVKLSKLKVFPGETYNSDEGIILSDQCVDFIVVVRCLISGGYKYYESNGKWIPHYDPRLNEKEKPKKYGRLVVHRKNITSSKISAFLAVILIAVFIAVCANVCSRSFGDFSSVASLSMPRFF